ncbi:MAG: hypothetical protein QXS46_04265 [Candidatus Bathyarchaeia archaeon]
MLKISFKELFPPSFLLINTLALINLTWFVIQDVFQNIPYVAFFYYFSIVVSGFIGIFLLREKLRSRNNLLYVTLIGALSYTIFSFTLENGLIAIISTIVIGASFGLTTPIYLSFSAVYSEIEKRGRFCSSLFFFTQFFIVANCGLLRTLNTLIVLLVMAGWKTANAIALLFCKSVMGSLKTVPHMKNAIRGRLFFLYFVPWLMFCLVNYIEGPIIHHFFGNEIFQSYLMMGASLAGVSAFLGGFICDFRGRRMAGILGFVLLGLSYGILSFFYSFDIVKTFFIVIEGIAWGILYVTFVFVIWGDISEGDDKEIYYFLGNLPFLLSNVIYFFAEKFKIAEIIAVSASFSVASFFIFLAVVPLLYAPETLPERVIREKELRSYVEKAKRLAEKYS